MLPPGGNNISLYGVFTIFQNANSFLVEKRPTIDTFTVVMEE